MGHTNEVPAGFEPLDFHRFHREELPERIALGNGALAARGAHGLGRLAFRLPNGDAYAYVPRADGIDVVAGDACADTVVELEAELCAGCSVPRRWPTCVPKRRSSPARPCPGTSSRGGARRRPARACSPA